MRKIDIFTHICPQKYIDAFNKVEPGVRWDKIAGMAARTGGQALYDIAKRLEMMDRYENYVQVLVPTGDAAGPHFSIKDRVNLDRIFNDSMAEITAKYPDRFVGAVAKIPMNDIEAALQEIERTINELGFKGILMHTPVSSSEGSTPGKDPGNAAVKALDSPEYMPIYESMAKYNLPIWIHPSGMGGVPVYHAEEKGKFMLFHMFGWPMESAMAMSRLVCSGILAKYPNLKFITHHCGSGIVPMLAGRIDDEFDIFSSVGALDWDKIGVPNPFNTNRPTDYFRMFYADTAIGKHPSGLMCGYEFFGAEHMVFGTDFPFDSANGEKFITDTLESIRQMNISDKDRQLIYEGNAKRILGLDT